MHFNNNANAATAISDLAMDMFQSRNIILNGRDWFTVVYRVSLDCYDDEDVYEKTVYLVMLYTKNWAYYYIYTGRVIPIDMDTRKGFIEIYGDLETPMEELDSKIQGSSYRRYIFIDLIQPSLKKAFDKAVEEFPNEVRPYLWNTMDIRTE